MKEDNKNMKEDNKNMKEDNKNMKEDNKIITTEIEGLKEDNKNLKEDNKNLKEGLAAMLKRLEQVEATRSRSGSGAGLPGMFSRPRQENTEAEIETERGNTL
jgi:FtsZ-binding cell division protein ZapB